MESRPRGGASSRAPPRPHEVQVKHIITRKVSTDEASFKDVVLRLTGKDSAAARAELLLGACDHSSIAPTTAPTVAAGGASSRNNVGTQGSGRAGFNTGAAVTLHDTVLPSLEEMDRWWGSHGIDSYADMP
ncbi:hypothetical protein ACQ4PT_054894 [Festuca glaucescens]